MAKKTTIGIFGFGRFGVLAATILSKDFEVIVYKHKETIQEQKTAKKIGVKLADFPTTVGCDYIILAVPISQTKRLIQKIAKQVNPHTTVLDTCSVKEEPCKWLRKYLPKQNEILGTHPMFGPVTTRFNLTKKSFELKNKQMILCPLRVSEQKLTKIKKFLKNLQLEVIITTPKEHDKQNAKTLSLVHFIGRSLTRAGVGKQEIYTPGYKDLLSILPHTNNDDWQLFYDMNNYNPESSKVRNDFLNACTDIEDKIIEADSNDDFDFQRRKIQKIDRELFSLLEKRMECAKEIGNYKKKNNLAVVDKKREDLLIKNTHLNCNLNCNFVEKIYRDIFDESYKQQ